MMAPVDGSGSWPSCRHRVLNLALGVSFTIRVSRWSLHRRSNVWKQPVFGRQRAHPDASAQVTTGINDTCSNIAKSTLMNRHGVRHALFGTLPGRAVVI